MEGTIRFSKWKKETWQGKLSKNNQYNRTREIKSKKKRVA